MNKLLPYYSPGLSGGGVSDNFLKDMMAEMQGAGGAGGQPGGGAMPDLSGLQNMMSMFGGGGGAGAGAGASAAGGAGVKKEKKQKQKIIRG